MQDRPATGRNRMDFHHRGAHAHTGNLGFEIAFIFAVIMRNVGRCAAHIKTDDLIKAIHFGGPHHADNTARRAGQYRILALELRGIGQPAIGLHEHQLHTAQFTGNLINITAQDRRQIGINNRGIATRHQFHQRTDLIADRYLGKADLTCDFSRRIFMGGITIAMHEHDGTCPDAVIKGGLQVTAQVFTIKGCQFRALRVKAAIGLDHALIQHFRQPDIAIKQLRAVLIGNAQRIAETGRGHQNRAVAFAFQKRIGRNRRAHLDGFDFLGRDFLARRNVKQFANALNGGIGITFRVFRQQLVRQKAAIGLARDNIGKGTATVDPELPFRLSGGLISSLRSGRILGVRSHDAYSFSIVFKQILRMRRPLNGAGQPFIFCGSQVAISGKTVISKTASKSRKKNGREARAMENRFLPVSPCRTKRLKPTGGVICDISTTSTT